MKSIDVNQGMLLQIIKGKIQVYLLNKNMKVFMAKFLAVSLVVCLLLTQWIAPVVAAPISFDFSASPTVTFGGEYSSSTTNNYSQTLPETQSSESLFEQIGRPILNGGLEIGAGIALCYGLDIAAAAAFPPAIALAPYCPAIGLGRSTVPSAIELGEKASIPMLDNLPAISKFLQSAVDPILDRLPAVSKFARSVTAKEKAKALVSTGVGAAAGYGTVTATGMTAAGMVGSGTGIGAAAGPVGAAAGALTGAAAYGAYRAFQG